MRTLAHKLMKGDPLSGSEGWCLEVAVSKVTGLQCLLNSHLMAILTVMHYANRFQFPKNT